MTATPNVQVRFIAPGRVDVESDHVPRAGAGQLLVRTTHSLISTGTELACLAVNDAAGAVWSTQRQYPVSPGYSNVGVVTEVGEGVASDWIGARVATGSPHAAYVIAAASDATRIPDGVSDEDATFMTLATTVMNGLRRSHLVWGESAGVLGLGVVGQLTARFCIAAGARPVIGINRSPERLHWFPKVAGAFGVSGSTGQQRKALMQHNREQLLDVVFETTGSPAAIERAPNLIRPEGRLVILGSATGPSRFDFHDQCNWTSISIIGAHARSHPRVAVPSNPWTVTRHGQMFFEMLARGDISVAGLVSHRVPFDQAARAYDILQKRAEPTMAVLLIW